MIGQNSISRIAISAKRRIFGVEVTFNFSDCVVVTVPYEETYVTAPYESVEVEVPYESPEVTVPYESTEVTVQC